MSGNEFGNIFKIMTFGESHGLGLGGVIDGCPAGLKLNIDKISYELNRRRPGQSEIVSPRNEEDKVIFMSGIFKNITTGTPIGFIIKNKDYKSHDYDNIKNIFRPSHSDFTYHKKYGIRDYRGGGRSSARETVCRVVAGSIAKQLLGLKNISIKAYVSSVGNIKLDRDYTKLNLDNIESNIVRCPDKRIANQMIDLIKTIRLQGDSVGGVITCIIQNVPIGLGEPVFNKLHAELGKAMLSINAVKGFEYGSGFEGAKMRGSQHNDIFYSTSGKTKTNFSGGIQGGISNGMDIYFRVAFKPVATILQDQITINEKGEKTKFKAKGRHDPCVVPRAVPIVESMTALVLIDYLLYNIKMKLI
jgi:chorismate synthase